MGIKKVWIEPGCISCGNCESVCPEVFEVTDESHVIPDADLNLYEEGIKTAAEECPVQVIKYEED
ncbi:MAG: ferredoxin [Bacteroidales bacterium]